MSAEFDFDKKLGSRIYRGGAVPLPPPSSEPNSVFEDILFWGVTWNPQPRARKWSAPSPATTTIANTPHDPPRNRPWSPSPQNPRSQAKRSAVTWWPLKEPVSSLPPALTSSSPSTLNGLRVTPTPSLKSALQPSIYAPDSSVQRATHPPHGPFARTTISSPKIVVSSILVMQNRIDVGLSSGIHTLPDKPRSLLPSTRCSRAIRPNKLHWWDNFYLAIWESWGSWG